MNTISTTEARTLAAAFTAGNPMPVTLEERSFDLYAEQFMTPEAFFGWMQSAKTERQSSAYWEPISNAELARVLLSKHLTGEQALAAMATLKRRFVTEHSKEIAALETSMQCWPVGAKDER